MTQLDQDDLRKSREAAAWLLEVQDDPSPGCRAAFASWLTESTGHVKKLLAVSYTALRLERVDPRREIDLEKLVAQVKEQALLDPGATALPAVVTLPRAKRAAKDSRRGIRRYWALAAGASIAVAATVVGFWATMALHRAQTYTTAIGELRSIKLTDGSLIDLNTASRVEVRYTGEERSVALLAGQALFSVEHDLSRPFRVRTDQAVIQTVGTQFDVYQQPARTTISVVDGEVEVQPSRGRPIPPGSSWRQLASTDNTSGGVSLKAGEQANVEADGRIRTYRPSDIMKAVQWRDRRLPFDGVALADVAEEFNRYNLVKIRVEGEALRAQPVSGIFTADHPETLFRYLHKLDQRIAVERTPEAFIVRSR